MVPLDGGTVLENWLFPDPVSDVLTTSTGEWSADPDQTYARSPFIDRLANILAAIEIRVDLTGRRFEVRLDAARATWSPRDRSAVGFVTEFPDLSRDGEPIVEGTFDDAALALRLICDPNPAADGTDADGIPWNDCEFARAARSISGVPVACPVQGNCDLLAQLDGALGEASDWVSSFSFRITSAIPTWKRYPSPVRPGDPDPGWPVLEIRYHAEVNYSLGIPSWIGTLNDVVAALGIDIIDYGFSFFEGSLLLALTTGDTQCPVPGVPDVDHGPGVTWTAFTPDLPGNVRWETRNLELQGGVPRDLLTIVNTDFHAGLGDEGRSLISTWGGNAAVWEVESSLRSAETAVQIGLGQLNDALEQFLQGYLSFLLPSGVPPIVSGQLWLAVSAMTEPTGVSEPGIARALAMRLMEGTAGASRYFWNAITQPLEWMDADTGTTSFEYTGTRTLSGPADAPRPTAAFELTSDCDCDGLPDGTDPCPTVSGSSGEPDSDGDTLGDLCDMCMYLPRADAATVRRWSSEYDPAPGTHSSVNDSDGDGVANRCDYCATMSAYARPDPAWAVGADVRAMENSWVDLDWSGMPPASFGPSEALLRDFDSDGIGNRCDNCPYESNRDQWNSNADWERNIGGISSPPSPYAVGQGDACDVGYPFVDSCIAPETSPRLRIDRRRGSCEWISAPDQDTAYVDVCPDMQASAASIDTEVRGCVCSDEEERSGTCARVYCRRNVAAGGTSWREVTYDAARTGTAGIILPAPYQYKDLYREDPVLGQFGARGEFGGYAKYYSEPGRTLTQEWNWLEDACPGGYGSGCRPWLRMWFRPERTASTSYSLDHTEYSDAYGNSYTQSVQADGAGIPNDSPWLCGLIAAPHGAGGGESTGLTTPWNMDDTGRVSINSSTLIDILRVPCLAEWGPCPDWPNGLLFDEPGTSVAGVAVSIWSAKSNDIAWTLGTKTKPGQSFDLLDSSAAFAYDANGDPFRYWLFGGRDAAGGYSDQMWGANLAVIDAAGTKTNVDATGLAVALKNAVAPDPSKVFYELSPVARGNSWPAARIGAVLACTGQAVSGGSACQDNCPRVGVALGLEAPPDGVTKPAGSLVLVGGEGSAGPLDDIWTYEEMATWDRPAAAATTDPGPWPSGWRRLGSLPGVAGGLSGAGVVQLGKMLWLVGGRTASELTADAFKLDLATGQADRIAARGSPGGRLNPAVAFDFVAGQLLVFGGTDSANRPLNDVWRIDTLTGLWSLVVPACTGSGCPPGGGRPSLFVSAPSGEINVVADRGLSTASTSGWTLREGSWQSVGERRGDLEAADCDGNGSAEPLFGLRCARAANSGYPDFGRMRCGGGALACRSPLVPASLVQERSMRDLAAVVASNGELLALRGSQVEAYRIADDGSPALQRTLSLRRAGHDLGVAGGALAVADPSGVTIYDSTSGTFLSAVPTCGKARRVFVDDRRAYVVGLMSVLVLDVTDPSAPVVLQRLRLLPSPAGLAMRSCGDCTWLDRGVDRLYDGLGAGGPTGRSAAAYDHGRLFVHLLGSVYVLDVRDGYGPAVTGWVPAGFVTELRAEGDFIYGNLAGRRTWVAAGQDGASWAYAGQHDVRRWVEGTVDLDRWTIHWEPGKLQVGTRQ
jgi:hypothetical protein